MTPGLYHRYAAELLASDVVVASATPGRGGFASKSRAVCL